jgi:hypothetical protein
MVLDVFLVDDLAKLTCMAYMAIVHNPPLASAQYWRSKIPVTEPQRLRIPITEPQILVLIFCVADFFCLNLTLDEISAYIALRGKLAQLLPVDVQNTRV